MSEGTADMDVTRMRSLFEAHRAAEAARDIDGILRTFRDGLTAGESVCFDLATLCEQAGIPLDAVRAAAARRRAAR
ncbi:hypothetical protein [Streptomyces sp. NPDC053367]|uniref:hypothetical protein n=1 Tax=Streptomyces sp. NPDC053367 TaxID=3365700 RepID=UPI0037D40714